MLAVDQLRFRYGPNSFGIAVDELRVDAGEAVALVGPSGSGKSTLISLLTGILEPNSGSVALAERPLSSLNDDARRARRIAEVGFVFQEFELLDYLTALDNILLPFRVAQHLRVDSDARRRARELARRCGIEHVLPRRPRRLSQGERQRVAICRALVTQPSLLVADEPTGNLDPSRARAVLDLLLDEVRSRDATLLTVTHDHGLLDAFDRVIDVAAYAEPMP